MVLGRDTFVIARTPKGRPTLQHRMLAGTSSLTLCGVETGYWSRVYMSNRIEVLLCRRCIKHMASVERG